MASRCFYRTQFRLKLFRLKKDGPVVYRGAHSLLGNCDKCWLICSERERNGVESINRELRGLALLTALNLKVEDGG
jgi:hypothetical protein